ncbi:MAG: SDR family oxidoreductase [Candidatus Competibacteraceae bacterium]|nr:SDR family oxidoreductase [Candidatus Competibacteraceae bacterium]
MQPVTLISGATAGMGRRTALLLARRGHRVFAGARHEDAAGQLRQAAAADGLEIATVPLDVTDRASVDQAVQNVLEQAGRIDNLVNNAGFGLLATVEEGSDQEFIRQFDVNVFGVLRLCRAVLPAMRIQGSGVIVNISSFLGRMGLPLLSHYNASKYAVEGITDSLRHEVRPFGIRVHSILPGLFGTDFVRRGLVASQATLAEDSPYAALVAKLVPVVSEKINQGPDPIAVAEAVARVIEDPQAPIRLPVGVEAETFVPLTRQLSDEDFEAKVREVFGL